MHAFPEKVKNIFLVQPQWESKKPSVRFKKYRASGHHYPYHWHPIVRQPSHQIVKSRFPGPNNPTEQLNNLWYPPNADKNRSAHIDYWLIEQ